MSHFVAYILQFQEIIVYKIPPGWGGEGVYSQPKVYLGKCDMFPFSRHSSVLSFSTRYIKVTRVLKESGSKQNYNIFAIAKSPQSYEFGCC